MCEVMIKMLIIITVPAAFFVCVCFRKHDLNIIMYTQIVSMICNIIIMKYVQHITIFSHISSLLLFGVVTICLNQCNHDSI